jgi:hypothetical protein
VGVGLTPTRGIRTVLGFSHVAGLIVGGGAAITADRAITATNADAGTAEKRYPIPASDRATIDRDAQVILVRYQNRIVALALACPHQNAAVNPSRILSRSSSVMGKLLRLST